MSISCRVIAGSLLCLVVLAGCAESTAPGGLTGSETDLDAAQADDGGPLLDAAHAPNGDGDGGGGEDAFVDAGGATSDGAIQDDASADASGFDAAVEDAAIEDAAIEDAAIEDAAIDASLADGGDGGDEPVDPDPLPSGVHVTLPFRIVDAEYSRALDRVVIVSTNPSRVILLEPESVTIEEVVLPFAPQCVSVHPNGTSAVIGHNGYVSVLDLDPLALLETWPVAVDVADIVLGADGHAYAFSNAFNGGDSIRILDLATGAETLGDRLVSFTVARLHPAGDRMYGAERNVSPPDILRIGISPRAYSYDSPYHGDYQTGRDLWLSEDGDRIFAGSGDVFRASDAREEDMTYRGSLEGRPYIHGLDHASIASLVAVTHVSRVFEPGEPLWPLRARLLSVYDDEFLDLRQTVTLPSFEVEGTQVVSNGRFVFFRSDGTRLYALVDAGENVAPLGYSALVRYSIEADEDLDPIVIDDPPLDPPVPVAAPSAGVMLDFSVTDAEYSRALDRIVMVAPDPDQLIALDPLSGALDAVAVALPLDPSSVSVHPDGASAAVGYDGFVSLVDLDPSQLIGTFPVTVDVFDVVLAGNGYAYATSASPSDWWGLHALHWATGQETWSTSAHRDTAARLHPAGDRIYGAERGVSPEDIKRFGIAAGTIGPSYGSPYHGDYEMCGDLWFSEDGARIFTACGNIFVASNIRGDDMTYLGALDGTIWAQYLDHSAAAGLLAVVTRAGGELLLFDDALLTVVAALPLPSVTVSGRTYPTTGRFAFFSADGSAVHVIAQAAGAPIVHKEVLVTFEP